LTPRAIVIVRANDKSRSPLARANHRSLQPTSSPRANNVSAKVAAQARGGMRGAGANQLALPPFFLFAIMAYKCPIASFAPDQNLPFNLYKLKGPPVRHQPRTRFE